MALLGMNGFEHRSTTPRPGGSVSGTYVAGRFGGFCWRGSGGSNNSYVTTLAAAVTGAFIVGWAFRQDSTSNFEYLKVTGGGVDHLSVSADASGSVTLFRGNASGTLLATSAPGVLTNLVWTYLELKCTIADAGGTAIVRVNGVEVINFTGDTRNAGTAAQVEQFTLFHQNSAGGAQWDDLYYSDTTGSAPYNDFLGDVKVETLVPNGAGASTQFVPSTGANWTCVDEQPAVMTDYVGSSTVGNRDTYAHTDLVTATGIVLAVLVTALAQASDAGAANLRVVTRTSATIRQGPVVALSASAAWVLGGVQTTDPTTAAWSIANVNASEFGVEVA